MESCNHNNNGPLPIIFNTFFYNVRMYLLPGLHMYVRNSLFLFNYHISLFVSIIYTCVIFYVLKIIEYVL